MDQSSTVTDPQGLALGAGPYGQTFVPKADNLAQVDLLLTVSQLTSTGVEVTISYGDPYPYGEVVDGYGGSDSTADFVFTTYCRKPR